MNVIYQSQHQVHSFQVDFRKQMRPSSMVRIFQEAATVHAEQLGIGYDALIEKGLFWVLSKIEMNIIEPLYWEDEFVIETWTVESEGLLFRRDFQFKKEDRVICKGSSGWLIVNEQKRRPVRPSTIKTDLLPFQNEGTELYFENKIKVEDDQVKGHIRIGYSDIDMHQHANNTRYFDWLLQCIPQETLKNNQIKSITIEYIKEASWGEILDVKATQTVTDETSSINVETVHPNDGKICFRGRCILA
ncbi:hypothetical protein K5X82_00650 [Halosquirtibacter xylanolyticus]|uniref:acyl-[acyl-carrier-protein] thioesterase n=1 Tax=Halosquirtibacter xylanolyticus TaxID=3374599 RepID=UPI003748CBF9|nr:hypothetical protein K5X82_00650 [Prolixibacteraceae bacterium]